VAGEAAVISNNHLLSLIAFLVLCVASLAWKTVAEIKKDLKEHLKAEQACREELKDNYVRWDVLNARVIDKLEADRKDKWRNFDTHRHADNGAGPPIKT